MVNRIVGNVYIVDSAGVYLTGSNATSIAGTVGGDLTSMLLSSVRFVASDSTGAMDLSLATNNSSDIIKMRVTNPAGGADDLGLSQPFSVGERVYVRTLTAGTGYLYFS